MTTSLSQIIHQYKTDSQNIYNIWYIDNEQHLNAFHTIRRRVLKVIENIIKNLP